MSSKNKDEQTHMSGLRVSTRDWDEDKKKKETDIQALSLVSRTEDNSKQSLRNVKVQHELWQFIKSKINQVKDEKNKKEWDPIVNHLRKLREGIYASHWSDGDYLFSIEVFELSVDCCIKAERFEELAKSLNGLIDQLYTLQKKTSKPYYILMAIIYQCCYTCDIKKAKHYLPQLRRKTNEGAFGKRLIEAMLTGNPILYFKLYHYNPFITIKILMKNYNDTMAKKAIDILRKAYLSASISWIGQWIGIYEDHDLIIAEIQRLVQPTCIKSIDKERQLVYFLKKPLLKH